MKDWRDNYTKQVRCSIGKKKHSIELLHETGKQMRSVWAINTPSPTEKKFGKHPTQKPLELLRRVILASTQKDDLILDPFTGSSTTGMAASLHKRHFIGIDLEKKFLDLSIKRFEALEHNKERKMIQQKKNDAAFIFLPKKQIECASM